MSLIFDNIFQDLLFYFLRHVLLLLYFALIRSRQNYRVKKCFKNLGNFVLYWEISFYIIGKFRFIYLGNFALNIWEILFYIFGKFCFIYLEKLILCIRKISFYIGKFRFIYSGNYVLYIREIFKTAIFI